MFFLYILRSMDFHKKTIEVHKETTKTENGP